MTSLSHPRPPVQETADQLWLARAKAALEDDGPPDPLGARAFAAAAVWDLTLSMRFHKAGTAVDYLDNPDVPERWSDVRDGRALHGFTRSTLARAMDALASELCEEGRQIAWLAAYVVRCRAAEAEALGSDTFDDYVADEAQQDATQTAVDLLLSLFV